MLKAHQILVRSLTLAACAAYLTACGQKGPLYFPTDPSASQRASLPQALGNTIKDSVGSSSDSKPGTNSSIDAPVETTTIPPR